VAAGETLLGPEITRRVVERYVQVPPARTSDAFATLTERELEAASWSPAADAPYLS
jgi:hypothetical protein